MTTLGPKRVKEAIASVGTKVAKGKPRLKKVQKVLAEQYGSVAYTPKAVDVLTQYVGMPLRGIPRS